MVLPLPVVVVRLGFEGFDGVLAEMSEPCVRHQLRDRTSGLPQ